MNNTPSIPESTVGSLSPLSEAARIIVDFLKWRFSKLPVGGYHYDLDEGAESNSEVFIGAETPIEISKVGQRPAITVLRAPAAFSGLGIGDLGYVDLRTGAEVYMDLLPTNITISVLSRTPVEAEGLAWFVATQYRAFWKLIVKKSNGLILTTGQRIAISSISPAGALVNDPTADWSTVVLTVPMYLQHAVTRLPMGQRIFSDLSVTVRST